ncbi:MAG: S9 family peptidase, partial [Candidatus Binataceae bacterium]
MAATPALIPREILLGNPSRWKPSLSPDGKRMAWLAPNDRDVLQIWIRTLGANDDRCVSFERRTIWIYGWAWDSNTILYGQDSDGDENYHTFAIDLATGNVRDLTPWQGVRSHYTMARANFPDEILAVVNVRDRKLMDVWRINLRTGAATPEVDNPGDVTGWVADDHLVVRGASVISPGGGFEIRVRADAKSPWRTLVTSSPEEEVAALGFSKDGREIFLKSSIASDTVRVVAREIESGRERELARMDGFDAERVMIHPTNQVVEAVAFEPGRRKWHVLDPTIAPDFAAIEKLDDGDFSIASRDLADRTWIVEYQSAHRAIHYFLWNRAAKSASFLWNHRPELDEFELAAMKPITYRARDGMELHAYLTTPVGVAPTNLPLVLFVHGGPWARDYWILDVWTQLLANRGYAVLRPNYRGSTGCGRKYLHAG